MKEREGSGDVHRAHLIFLPLSGVWGWREVVEHCSQGAREESGFWAPLEAELGMHMGAQASCPLQLSLSFPR